MTSPIIDLSLFTSGNPANSNTIAAALLDSLHEHGFAKIVGHGIPEWAVTKLFEWNKSFFRMRMEDKASIANPGGSAPQRGWSAVGAENSSTLYRKGLLKSRMTEDLKDAREHFDQGAKSDLQFPTRWPDENLLPGFREEMEEAFEMMEGVAAQIMKALEVAYGLPSGAFFNRVTHDANASEMRLNHYPAIDIREVRSGGVSRIWPHFDLGVITLLFQDAVGGLEFENRKESSTFSRVECGSVADMVVNVSETLQRWTNGNLKAGLHRVSVPQDLDGKEKGMLPERYSIAYFCKADRGASVGPLKQFVREGDDPKYEDISAIEYHQQRLQSAY